MSWIDRLSAKFGRYAVPNLTLFLIAGQVLAYVANSTPAAAGGASLLDGIRFVPDKFMAGEWWRAITFLFDPPLTNALFAFFFWYLFYLMGTTLEAEWGAFRYNVFLLLGYVASIATALVAWLLTGVPGQVATNGFLYGSIFLAFARLYPDFTIQLFFVFPVKIRWLALLQWAIYGMTLVSPGPLLNKAMVVAAVFNYLVFFGREMIRDAKHGHRRRQFKARAVPATVTKKGRMQHRCQVCGLSSADAPKTPFRYCSECGGEYSYCPEHIHNHQHLPAADTKQ